MKLAMTGLGKMGANMVRRLLADGHQVAVYDVDDTSEGRWTVHDAIDLSVPMPVLTLALQLRFRSRQNSSFAGKVLNAMRAGFGGHSIRFNK